MSKQLHVYQADLSSYVDTAEHIYRLLSNGVKDHLGGIVGKTVLDLGVGFQLVHGGLTLALALQEGASRCFGIDIAHPDLFADDPQKVEFWKAAKERTGIQVEGLENGRVIFASTNILHFDDFFSKITLLQMSASNMYFRDNMFDVAISNAVFEHVQKPREVLAELFRVLKPGGGASINWNPFAGFRMGGHDIGTPYHYPWAHLRLDKQEHAKKLGEVFSDPKLFGSAFPPEHTPTAERAAVYASDPALFLEQISYDLNKMRIPEFLAHAQSVGFEIAASIAHIDDAARGSLTPEVRNELKGYSEEELLQIFHHAVLRKPL